MTPSRRTVGLGLITAGACLLAAPMLGRLAGQEQGRLAAQEQAPSRREFTVSAREFRFTPDRIEVMQNDLVKLTVSSGDVAYGFTIDQYRVSKRVPAGGTVTFEFRVDSAPGSFAFYSNMTNDPRHGEMKGQIVVRPR